ncbi:MAG: Wzz/FepE/Etk N-terminal domain-containing protein [Anaerolineaceae bacterium]
MNDDFSPSLLFSRLLHFWWIMGLLMIFGGGAGVLLSRAHQPVYESKATITSALDYSVLGKLDDYEEDQVFVAIGEIIGSTSVKQAVVSDAQKNNLGVSEADILDNLSLDRMDNRWVMRVRLSDPQLAQQINGYWASNAMQALIMMKVKAVTNFANQQFISSIVSCLQESVILESGSTSCGNQNYEMIQSEIKKIVDDPSTQIASDSLILLHTSFELTDEPNLPNSPVLFGQNISALAGILIAMFLGLVAFSTDFPHFLKKKA